MLSTVVSVVSVASVASVASVEGIGQLVVMRMSRHVQETDCGQMEIEDRTMNDPNLRALPGSLVGRYWPAERVVMGMRASSWLRQELLAYAERIIFQVTGKMPAQGDGVDRNAICNDLTRFQHPHQRVVVRVARRCEDFDGFSAGKSCCLPTYALGAGRY